jgi:hypothetical protein
MSCLRKRKIGKTKRKKKTNNLASPFFGYTIFLAKEDLGEITIRFRALAELCQNPQDHYIMVILFMMTRAARACIQKR